MRIKFKLIIMFSLVIIVAVSSTSYISFKSLESAIIESQLRQMGHEVEIKANLIDNLNSRASEDLLFAVKNPVFVKYFELPDTQAGNIYKDGVYNLQHNRESSRTNLTSGFMTFRTSSL